MFNTRNTSLTALAERLSAEDIFTISGTWTSSTSTVGNLEVTTYSRVIHGRQVTLQSLFNPVTNEESAQLQPVSAGAPLLPIHKAAFITQFIFDNDEAKAYAWVKSIASPTYTWLSDLGNLARRHHGDQYPEVEDGGVVSEMVGEEYLRSKAREQARQLIAEDSYRDEGETPEPLVVSDWMNEPDVEAEYRIDQLWIRRGTNFVVAQNKAGKTTLILNVARALLDGSNFLGRFETLQLTRKLGIVNFELTDAQLKRWVKRLGITKLEDFLVWNLKGKPNPFRTKTSREHFARQLLDNDIEVLIVDPFSSAFPGDDANQNELVKAFLKNMDEVVLKGGVEEFMMVVHAGHDGKRARGASTLADHPDATWVISKQETGNQRTFRAEGRDVSIEEEGLTLEEDGLSLTLNGLASREMAGIFLRMKVKTFIGDNPGCKAGQLELSIGGNKAALTAARNYLVSSGEVTETLMKNAKVYYLNS